MPLPEIAFDVTPLQNAHRHRGIGTYVRGLAHRLLAQSEFPIEFWGWSGGEPFEVPPPHRALWLPRFPMPEYRGAWLFAQLAMKRRARRSNVNVVHITDPDALAPLGKRKLLATVYDLIPLKQGVDKRRLIAVAGYSFYLRGLRHADKLFAISTQTAADLVEMLRIPQERILIARPGIELPGSTPPPHQASRPYFLFLGGPNPNKNLSVLVEAMTMCADLPEELVIAGHWLPKQVAALDSQLEAAGLRARARHAGFVPAADLPALMTGATALVIPSLHEGFGLPVAEGLAARAAVIHSRLPVLEEISAGAAMTFDPRSATELAGCLRRASGDAERLGELRRRGGERAKDLTWDAAVETTLSFYRSLK